MELFDFQKKALEQSKGFSKVAYYYDMGLGKTFIGAEKLKRLNKKKNLVVCQHSKIGDWTEHFEKFYPEFKVFDLTKNLDAFMSFDDLCVGIINYELLIKRPQIAKLKDFTLLLDESSMIQNETAKRTKFIMKMMNFENLILLSGTPTGGKYEKLYSQLSLLGWKISKTAYWNKFICYRVNNSMGFPLKIVTGYKNIELLKLRMAEYGCFFKKTDEVFSLPEQIFSDVNYDTGKYYKRFLKFSNCEIDGEEFVGDTSLSQLLYERLILGAYAEEKITAVKDLIESTEDRIIIFYNFNDELRKLENICIKLDRPTSIINGQTKDLSCYEEFSNSVTLVQYQAGAMGLNLQKANRMIFNSPCLSSELFEQAKKRIHRIGQEKTCFYYRLIGRNSVEEQIYETLDMRKDFTDELFEGRFDDVEM